VHTTSVATLGKSFTCRLRSTQPFFLNWWINRVPAVTTAGVRAGHGHLCWVAGNCVIPYDMQAPVAMLLAKTAICFLFTLYLPPIVVVHCLSRGKKYLICLDPTRQQFPAMSLDPQAKFFFWATGWLYKISGYFSAKPEKRRMKNLRLTTANGFQHFRLNYKSN